MNVKVTSLLSPLLTVSGNATEGVGISGSTNGCPDSVCNAKLSGDTVVGPDASGPSVSLIPKVPEAELPNGSFLTVTVADESRTESETASLALHPGSSKGKTQTSNEQRM